MADEKTRSGMTYATEAILAYVDRVHGPHDDALDQAFRAPELEGVPPIMVSPPEGRLLTLLMRLLSARRVVEVGTLAGFSAISLARGMAEGGRLFTIEIDPRMVRIATANIAKAGLGDRVEVLPGAAAEVLPRLAAGAPFDAVFLDADKERYDLYARWAADHVRPGGLLIADNSYYFGRLMEAEGAAPAMRRFHEEVARAFDSVCVPTPDGMVLGIRRP
jgi:caffeoyl-CoA O-methyltransferase